MLPDLQEHNILLIQISLPQLLSSNIPVISCGSFVRALVCKHKLNNFNFKLLFSVTPHNIIILEANTCCPSLIFLEEGVAFKYFKGGGG